MRKIYVYVCVGVYVIYLLSNSQQLQQCKIPCYPCKGIRFDLQYLILRKAINASNCWELDLIE